MPITSEKKHFLVKDGGKVISKEIIAGDVEMALEVRKALYPEYTYEETAEAAFDAHTPTWTSNYLKGNKWNKDNSNQMHDIIKGKVDQIKSARVAAEAAAKAAKVAKKKS